MPVGQLHHLWGVAAVERHIQATNCRNKSKAKQQMLGNERCVLCQWGSSTTFGVWPLLNATYRPPTADTKAKQSSRF
jgi:hypothetical protein